MNTEITNRPFLDIVNRAAKSKATGPAQKLRERFVKAGDETIALCDVSPSMDDLVGSTHHSKFEHLAAALRDLMKGFPRLIIVAFSSTAATVNIADFEAHATNRRRGGYSSLPGCNIGGTMMGDALEYVARRWKPKKTILISDGLPDSEQHALDAVELLTGSIDTIYCGADADPAVAFLRSLSRAGIGTHVTWDGASELAPTLRHLAIEGPSKKAIEL